MLDKVLNTYVGNPINQLLEILKVIDYPKVANSAQELLYSFQNEIHLQKNLRSLSHLTFSSRKRSESRKKEKRKFMFCRFFPMPMSFAQPNYFSHILSLCYLYSFSKALAKCIVRNYRRILKL